MRENIFITLSKEKIPFQVNQIVSLFFFRNPIIQNKKHKNYTIKLLWISKYKLNSREFKFKVLNATISQHDFVSPDQVTVESVTTSNVSVI